VPTDYRLAPAIAVRLIGALLVAIALLVFVATGLVAVLDLHTAVLLVPVCLGLALLVAAAWTWSKRGWVFRATDEGYRVQWVRGAGTKSARWIDVEDAVTTESQGSPVVRLRLKDGRHTTIPVEALAMDREEFVRELQQHLAHGTAR
jgi:hypothetical protein